MRFSVGLVAIITSFTLAGCTTPEEREVAALEKELGLGSAPYFPKCLSEEVAPGCRQGSGEGGGCRQGSGEGGGYPRLV